jgi:competence protein ComEC
MKRNTLKLDRKNKKNSFPNWLVIVGVVVAVVLLLWILNSNPEFIDILFPEPNATDAPQVTQVEPTKPAETTKPDNKEGATSSSYTDSILTVYFFDVGQADSILLMTDDKVMLVDTGNAGDADTTVKVKDKINLSHELDRLGISKIDYLVATHPHEDHMGSMYKIIKLFDVKELYANKILPEHEWTNYYKRFVEALDASNTHLVTPTIYSDAELQDKINVYNRANPKDEQLVFNSADYFRVGDTIPFGNASVTILAPNSESYSDTNDYSIVLLVEFEDVKLLLTGDAGKASEKEMIAFANANGIDLNVDILKVGHHGSRTANTQEFISMVDPEYAIIMVEEENSYGLPDEDVLERLEKQGAVIYMTQEYGDIKLTINDGAFEFDLSYAHEVKGAK